MTKNSDVLSSDLMSVRYPVGIDEPGRREDGSACNARGDVADASWDLTNDGMSRDGRNATRESERNMGNAKGCSAVDRCRGGGTKRRRDAR